MGLPQESQPPVKLFFALMARPGEAAGRECERRLEAEYGPVDLRGALYAFDPYTDYYAREFGEGLEKRIVSVEPLAPPEALAAVKRATNALEEETAGAGGRRRVNVDPGYLNDSKVVLATTKDHAHRIYVGGGVFEEVTLSYRRDVGGFQPNPWTYADYRAPERLAFFGEMRARRRRQMRES